MGEEIYGVKGRDADEVAVLCAERVCGCSRSALGAAQTTVLGINGCWGRCGQAKFSVYFSSAGAVRYASRRSHLSRERTVTRGSEIHQSLRTRVAAAVACRKAATKARLPAYGVGTLASGPFSLIIGVPLASAVVGCDAKAAVTVTVTVFKPAKPVIRSS